jgi:hypothetical protein
VTQALSGPVEPPVATRGIGEVHPPVKFVALLSSLDERLELVAKFPTRALELHVSTHTLSSVLSALQLVGVLLIMAGGLAFVLQARTIGTRLLIAGIVVAVLAAVTINQLSAGFSVSILDAITGSCGVLALCAWALKLRRPAYVLGTIAIGHWIVWPAVLWAMTLVPVWILLVVLVPFGAFIAIWLLQHSVQLWYGDDAGAHVAGTYLVRVFDAIGRAILWLLAAPLRLLRRR